MIESIDASPHAVRKTGRAFLFVGCAVAAYLFLRHSHVSGWWDWNWRQGLETIGWRWFIGSGLVVFLAGHLAYPVMKPLHVGWMLLARAGGWVSTRIVLCVFFYLVVTPVAWLLRLFRQDLLEEKSRREVPSYWKQKTRPLDPRHLERQF